MSKHNSLGIGLAGFGTVGYGVWDLLSRNGELIDKRSGGNVQFHVAKILVRDIQKAQQQGANVPPACFTKNWEELVASDEVQLVVELIGGLDVAYQIIRAALLAKKPVITGNKALLAERGAELFELSRKMDTPIHFEAAVAGGIPIIRAVQESLIGNHIRSFTGIINGTSNYILGRMTDSNLDFQTALEEAQVLGYAEADPALDVNGWDAAHKAILLGALAYGFPIEPKHIYVTGIEQVRPIDITFAKQLGYVVKLLAIIRQQANGAIEMRVQPSFLTQSHILASVNGVFNAIALNADGIGEALFYGRGAGQEPTATSVISDLVEAARSLQHEQGHRGFNHYQENGTIVPIEETCSAYYVRFDVTDRLGVIAEISKILADHGIGISGTHSPVDSKNPDAAFVDMVFLLHSCPFGLLQKALHVIEALDCVNSHPVVFRIENLT